MTISSASSPFRSPRSRSVRALARPRAPSRPWWRAATVTSKPLLPSSRAVARSADSDDWSSSRTPPGVTCACAWRQIRSMNARPSGPPSQARAAPRSGSSAPSLGKYGGLEMIRSNRLPATGVNRSPRSARTLTPLSRAFSRVARTARRETSMAVTSRAPRRAASIASSPLPVHRSRTVAPGNRGSRPSWAASSKLSLCGLNTPGIGTNLTALRNYLFRAEDKP